MNFKYYEMFIIVILILKLAKIKLNKKKTHKYLKNAKLTYNFSRWWLWDGVKET